MLLFEWTSAFLLSTLIHQVLSADDDFNVLNRDGSYEFGYNNPDSFHYSQANRNNIVRGRFGGRNPGTGAVDTTVYTAGPRGYRPRGKDIARKFDLNQSGPRPIGSKDDPYFDPSEDPSYNFGFRTPTYSRQEAANRVGDVNGRYTYFDDENVRHDVQYIAGKNTGFHVLTPYPDSNPRAYGNGYFRGRGNPPRGRTSIQRGLDGSYKFVSAGPDQRRTETSDAVGNVRGSYTYLDEKGVQHAVHYIAGAGIGYRVLKNVKGPHLPTIHPFGRPEIIPADFYDKDLDPDLFDTAASGHVKPIENNLGVSQTKPNLPSAIDSQRPSKPASGGNTFGSTGDNLFGSGSSSGGSKPSEDYDEDIGLDDLFQNNPPTKKPGKNPRPNDLLPPINNDDGPDRPTGDDESYQPGIYDDDADDNLGRPGGVSQSRPETSMESSDDDKELFGIQSGSKPFGPGVQSGSKPFGSGAVSSGTQSKPFGTGIQSASKPQIIRPDIGTSIVGGKPSPGTGDSDDDDFDFDFKPASSGRPVLQLGVGGTSNNNLGSTTLSGQHLSTIVKNVGDTLFTVPPGASVRAHVQSIDLLPLRIRTPSPSEQYQLETSHVSEQLNAETSNINQHVTTTISSLSSTESSATTNTPVSSSVISSASVSPKNLTDVEEII